MSARLVVESWLNMRCRRAVEGSTSSGASKKSAATWKTGVARVETRLMIVTTPFTSVCTGIGVELPSKVL